MSLKNIQTDHAPKAIGPYSQAITTDGFLFISGQIPLDPKTGEVVVGDVTRQTEQVLENLKAIVTAGGANLSQVVKTTIFIKDMNHFAAINAVYAKHFTQPYPARSTVEVARLPRDVLVEIEAIVKI